MTPPKNNIGLSASALLAVIVVTMMSPLVALAETVTQKQAMSMAQQFFNQAYHESTAPVKMVYNGKRLTTDRLFTPFYVYNHPRGGFVIISAENKTLPILAYSLKSGFDPNMLTDSEKNWLESYARDIELIRYDSRVPDNAIRAWQNYPEFIVRTLDAPIESFDSSFSKEDARIALENILLTEDASRDGEYSMFYSPAQWQEMIDSEMSRQGGVALGYVNEKKDLTPAVVTRKKGDYYRLEFDDDNEWWMRLMPAEYLGERMIAVLGNPAYRPEAIPEERSFEFYDSYINEHIASFQPSTSSIEQARLQIEEEQPVVKTVGGGNFDVWLPENVKLAMLYNLSGSHLGRHTYGGSSNVAHINLEAQPSGFYFALIFGESGKEYGVKLYR